MLQNGLFRGLTVIATKGRETPETLEDYDANAPLVTSAIIPRASNDFRCHVLTCANNTLG